MNDIKTMVENLKEFHKAFDLAMYKVPCIPSTKTALLRSKLIVSEAAETVEAMANEDLLEVLDGLIDDLYVVVGTAIAYGLGDVLPAAFAKVHKNNMSKLGPDGKPIKDASGKVVKPEGYVPVDLKPFIDGSYKKPIRAPKKSISSFKGHTCGECAICGGLCSNSSDDRRACPAFRPKKKNKG